ncbi:MAG: hypothetical protein J0M15_04510 [Deltaproteobacteria bacterium]|jgi:hypothetical protein|nr:hypothetical protein [Deltaproteobacteria bacterium]
MKTLVWTIIVSILGTQSLSFASRSAKSCQLFYKNRFLTQIHPESIVGKVFSPQNGSSLYVGKDGRFYGLKRPIEYSNSVRINKKTNSSKVVVNPDFGPFLLNDSMIISYDKGQFFAIVLNDLWSETFTGPEAKDIQIIGKGKSILVTTTDSQLLNLTPNAFDFGKGILTNYNKPIAEDVLHHHVFNLRTNGNDHEYLGVISNSGSYHFYELENKRNGHSVMTSFSPIASELLSLALFQKFQEASPMDSHKMIVQIFNDFLRVAVTMKLDATIKDLDFKVSSPTLRYKMSDLANLKKEPPQVSRISNNPISYRTMGGSPLMDPSDLPYQIVVPTGLRGDFKIASTPMDDIATSLPNGVNENLFVDPQSGIIAHITNTNQVALYSRDALSTELISLENPGKKFNQKVESHQIKNLEWIGRGFYLLAKTDGPILHLFRPSVIGATLKASERFYIHKDVHASGSNAFLKTDNSVVLEAGIYSSKNLTTNEFSDFVVSFWSDGTLAMHAFKSIPGFGFSLELVGKEMANSLVEDFQVELQKTGSSRKALDHFFNTYFRFATQFINIGG